MHHETLDGEILKLREIKVPRNINGPPDNSSVLYVKVRRLKGLLMKIEEEINKIDLEAQ